MKRTLKIFFLLTIFLSCDTPNFFLSDTQKKLIGSWETTFKIDKNGTTYDCIEKLTFNKDFSIKREEIYPEKPDLNYEQNGTYNLYFNNALNENFRGTLVINYVYPGSSFIHENLFYFSFIKNDNKPETLQLINEYDETTSVTYFQL